MANSNISITPGAGANIAVDTVGGVDYQAVKLDGGVAGASQPILGTTATGLLADVSRIQTTVTVAPLSGAQFPINDGGNSITVDFNGAAQPVSAPANAPVAVQLSNGSSAITALPISGNVTSAQGTAAANAQAWPIKISDGTNTAGITAGALNVNISSGAGGGAAQVDASTYSAGSTDFTPVGGVYNDSITAPASGTAASARITSFRGVHVNLRTNGGVEIGTSGSPVRTDPTGSTTQPVSIASGNVGQSGAPWSQNVTQIAGGAITPPATGILPVALNSSTGTALTAATPLVTIQKGQSETRVTKTVALLASQTAAAVWTPATGKKYYVRQMVVTVVGSDTLQIFDGTNAAGNQIYQGTPPVGGIIVLNFSEPWPSSTANNVLGYTSGASLTGDVVVYGYEA